MYPFSGENSFLRNCWYIAAFADELDAGPVERVIMDEPVALFRMADGVPAAMWGMCPHRYYPLAKGKVMGHSIQCAYHGFQFDGRNGACTRVPSQDTQPARFRQKIYPLVEHGPWLWIWPGDAERADPALLPPIAELGVSAPEWRVDHVGLLPTAGRAQLMVENLMDLTHIAFLHGVLVDGTAFLSVPLAVADEGHRVKASRVMETPWVSGFYDLLFGQHNRFEGLHATETQTCYYSPGYIRTNSGNFLSIEGKDGVDPTVYGEVRFHHGLTPETAGSTHYFSSFSRNYRLEDDAFSAALKPFDRDVRMQDVVAAGEIENGLRRYPAQGPELLAKSDVAAMRIRRIIQAKLDAEAAATA